MSNVEDFDLDLLDSTIDDLADYVGFEPVPRGDYLAIFGYEITRIGDNELPAIRANFKVTEVLQLANPEDTPPAEGKEVGILYILRNKEGKPIEFQEGLLKRDILNPLREVTGGDKISEILENGDGNVVAVTFGLKKRKTEPGEDPIWDNVIKALAVQQ